ncbi:MAG TPA: hypothetical protein VKM94_03260 [Blastocatellia bacterium]|nr:hypothetical protein [Blastocatellia bacterium]
MASNARRYTTRNSLPFAILFILGFSVTGLAQSISDQPKPEVAQPPAEGFRLTTENREKLVNYKGKNGIVSIKTVVMGGDFRVTTIIPFKGNLADYHHLEIVGPVSFVGNALTSQVADHQLDKFKSQFEERKIFDSVTVVDSYKPGAAGQAEKRVQANSERTVSPPDDTLDSSIGSFSDMESRDKLRLTPDRKAEPDADLTLVAVIEVLDYAKGNRIKQALPLDLGKSILTVRLRYYDKDTGEEIGRQIVSGKSGGSSLLGPLSPRDALSGVADGFVDQVTRRVAASVR